MPKWPFGKPQGRLHWWARNRPSKTDATLAKVAELVDAHDSKSCILGCAGSIPAFGTRAGLRVCFFI